MPPSNSGSGPKFDRGTEAVLSLRERLTKTFLKPPKPAAEAQRVRDRPMTDQEKRTWIRGLEPIERKWGMILAAYGALVALYLNLPDVLSAHYVHEKITPAHGHAYMGWVSTRQSAEILLGVQLALALGAFLGAYFRKRPILGFFLLIGAFASNVLGIPMLIMAGWIFMRSWRVQRYGSPDAKVAAKVSAERRAAKKRGEKVPGVFSRPSTVDADSTVTGPKRASEGSKRYTPPKPKKEEPKRASPAKASNKAKKGAPKKPALGKGAPAKGTAAKS